MNLFFLLYRGKIYLSQNLFNIMYFLQKDDIMLHFTLSGSSDITGCPFHSIIQYHLNYCLVGNGVNWRKNTFLIFFFLRLST